MVDTSFLNENEYLEQLYDLISFQEENKVVDTRFDNRSKGTFKKDIHFATKLEKYFFNKFVDICHNRDDIHIDNMADNGVDNDGKFVEGINTSGADYRVDIEYLNCIIEDHPLEIKWVPTAGKLTLKVADLKAYIRERASILFIYNTINCGTNLKKPRDYNFEKHVKLIESKSDQIKWGIMFADDVKRFLEEKEDEIQPIFYMGNKKGIILEQKEFGQWFTEENWSV